MTEEQIQPQSAVDSQPKFQKPRKQKVRKDPNAPFIREKLELPEGHNKLLTTRERQEILLIVVRSDSR